MSSQSKNKNSNKILLAVLLFVGAAAYFLINSGVVDPSEGTSSGIRGVEKADKNISKNDVIVELDDNYLEDQINNATQNNVLEKNQIETKFKAKGGGAGSSGGSGRSGRLGTSPVEKTNNNNRNIRRTGGKGGVGSSDRRIKKNIFLIGHSPSGLNIYSFEYINKIYGNGIWQGVMSDEVPNDAVIKNFVGKFDGVDYSRIDVEFKKIK